MRVLNFEEKLLVSGAAVPDNGQIIRDIGMNASIGAGFSPGAPWLGAMFGAAGSVIVSGINHGPVRVPMPTVPMGPSWTRPGPPAPRMCRIQGGYQFCE
jgi:hypothetical protein